MNGQSQAFVDFKSASWTSAASEKLGRDLRRRTAVSEINLRAPGRELVKIHSIAVALPALHMNQVRIDQQTRGSLRKRVLISSTGSQKTFANALPLWQWVCSTPINAFWKSTKPGDHWRALRTTEKRCKYSPDKALLTMLFGASSWSPSATKYRVRSCCMRVGLGSCTNRHQISSEKLLYARRLMQLYKSPPNID